MAAMRLRALLLVALLAATVPVTLAPRSAEAAGSLQSYVTGLNVPIALAFTSDGRVFFAERNTGSIRVIVNGSLQGAPYYTLAGTGTIYNRVVRITGNATGTSHSVIAQFPPVAASNHNGGVIAFGPDGKLYVVIGEDANIPLAQDLTNPKGKVLRINGDGAAPTDNPFFGSLTVDNRISTFGHRNMFGLTFH